MQFDYEYIFNLFRQYRKMALGDHNGSLMFKAVLQEYDLSMEKAFILCVVTGLMS